MKIQETNVKRCQVVISDLPMTVDGLIAELQQVRRLTKVRQIVGMPEGLAGLFGGKSLIVQWDVIVTESDDAVDEAPGQED